MRRVAGLTLSALGAFLIVLALLIRFVVVGEAVKFPLNENTVTTLVANNASYFSPNLVKELTGVTLQDTLTVQGIGSAGNSGTAVWKEFSYVYDTTNKLTVSYTQERLAFDRRSGALIQCCGNYVGTISNPKATGQGYVWPFNTQKKTYTVYNTTLLRPETSVYAGTAVVDGLNTDKFVETDAPTQFGSQTIPGTLIGLKSSADVTLPEYYQAVTTEFVDPVTGAPVQGISNQHVYLQDSSGADVLDLVKADFVTTPATVASLVHTVKNDDNEISLITDIVPLIVGIVGLLLLVIGIILAVTGRIEGEYEEEQYDEGEYKAGEVKA